MKTLTNTKVEEEVKNYLDLVRHPEPLNPRWKWLVAHRAMVLGHYFEKIEPEDFTFESNRE